MSLVKESWNCLTAWSSEGIFSSGDSWARSDSMATWLMTFSSGIMKAVERAAKGKTVRSFMTVVVEKALSKRECNEEVRGGD